MGENSDGFECEIADRPADPMQRRSGRITLATCVDSLRESWRKISGGGARKEPDQQDHFERPPRRQGGHVSGVRRKRGLLPDYGVAGSSEAKRKTSFELFLSTLPKLDPIDRTVGWVFHQPIASSTDATTDSMIRLPQRGTIAPNPRPDSQGTLTSAVATSLSYCESARGTQGRGTPPEREAGQPRLDDLFRQLQLRQERAARRRLARKGERHLTSRNLDNITSSQMPGYPAGVTPDILPYLSNHPPTILHKNSSYYNKVGVSSSTKPHPPAQQCGWAACRVQCSTSKELLTHVVDDHLSLLPLRGVKGQPTQLICEWRGCNDGSRTFGARYKLLVHVQTIHCHQNQKVVEHAAETLPRNADHQTNTHMVNHGAPQHSLRTTSTRGVASIAKRVETKTAVSRRTTGLRQKSNAIAHNNDTHHLYGKKM